MTGLTSPIGVGLLGAGQFGRTLAEVVSELPEFRLKAVYDVDGDRAADVARSFDARVCATVDDLLGTSGIDAVLIASSHDTHAPLTIAAASAKKHVFCEKPMAIRVAECEAMIAAAREHGVNLLVGQVTRLMPPVRFIRRVLDDGAVGRPVAMHLVRSGWFERHGWWASAAASGGMLHSHGAHMFDLANSFLGRPMSISSVAAPRIQTQVDYDDTIFSLITYESGAIASVGASISGQTWVYRGGIIGERGSIQFELALPSCWVEVHPRGQSQPMRETFGTFDQESLEGVRCELENFADMLLHGEPAFVSAEAALDAVAMIQAAYESEQSGAPVPISAVSAPASMVPHDHR